MVKLFGTTIAETSKAFAPIHAGGTQSTKDDKTKAIGRIIVTCLLLFLGAYLFTSGSKDVGGTIVGAVIGYWMK